MMTSPETPKQYLTPTDAAEILEMPREHVQINRNQFLQLQLPDGLLRFPERYITGFQEFRFTEPGLTYVLAQQLGAFASSKVGVRMIRTEHRRLGSAVHSLSAGRKGIGHETLAQLVGVGPGVPQHWVDEGLVKTGRRTSDGPQLSIASFLSKTTLRLPDIELRNPRAYMDTQFHD